MHLLGIIHSLIQSTFGGSNRAGLSVPLVLKGARVGYRNQGRSGAVVFRMGLRSFEMYYEFGGGDTVAIIDVPSQAEWFARTRFPIEQRQSILEFIGATVAKDQVSKGRGRYEIHDDCIRILTADKNLDS